LVVYISSGIYAIVAGTNQRSCGDGNCFRDNLVVAERVSPWFLLPLRGASNLLR